MCYQKTPAFIAYFTCSYLNALTLCDVIKQKTKTFLFNLFFFSQAKFQHFQINIVKKKQRTIQLILLIII